MIESESEHWKFAYLSAIIRLEFLIWDFDFDKEVGHRNFTEYPNPGKLIAVVDGFLADLTNLYQGDIRRLKEIRERLSTKLLVAYNDGEQKAHQLWEEASDDVISEYMEYDSDKYRNIARSLFDPDRSLAEKSWYLEAFCKKWTQEWIDTVRHETKSE